MTDQDAELLFGTLRNMADLYWMGQQASTLTDPRIERSWVVAPAPSSTGVTSRTAAASTCACATVWPRWS